MQKNFLPVFILFALLFVSFSLHQAFAKTPSNCVNTVVGTAPVNPQSGCSGQSTGGNVGSGNALADYAHTLAKAIDAHCPATNFPIRGYAIVSTSTQSCIDAINSGNKITDVIAWLHLNTNQAWNGKLQCAGFVQALSLGIGKQLPNNPNSLQQDYGHNVSGYRWYAAGTQTIQPGDIPLWNTHIAVVVSIPSPGHFTVAEANGGSGTVGEETYITGDEYGLHYLGFLRKDSSIL